MKRIISTMSGRKKIMFAMLAVIIGFLMITTSALNKTIGDLNYGTILSFEQENPVYEKSVEIGTAWDKLKLPTSLRAVLKIEEVETVVEVETTEIFMDNETSNDDVIADETADDSAAEPAEEAFIQTKPDGKDCDCEQYGYIAPKNEDKLREGGKLVVYTLLYEDGREVYRVHGELYGENESFYACDENGNITGIVQEIPVTWSGVYKENTPGTYTLTAQIDKYNYSGKNPTAKITVLPEQTEEKDKPDKTPEKEEKNINEPNISEPKNNTNTGKQLTRTTPEHIVIPVGTGAPGVGTYKGYSVVNVAGWGNRLIFNTGANAYTYELTQTGNLQFYHFVISTGVETTITLNGVNWPFNLREFELQGNADITFLLTGTNTFGRNIVVPKDAKLTIDSANSSGSTDGSLSVAPYNGSAAAAIGSSSGNTTGGTLPCNSGIITIKGGTITATQIGTANGAAIGGGEGYLGTVIIEGGNVTATGVNGAAIGGGSNQNGTSTVTITGGTVTAASNGNGAAIGGGYGSYSIGKVTITDGNVTAKYDKTSYGTPVGSPYGAAIGGGRYGKGIVNISNGKIIAEAHMGAAIGGGYGSNMGSTVPPGIGEVTITGGDLNLKSYAGACIGQGGSTQPGIGTNIKKGYVTITGGTIFADFQNGNAVGSGWNFSDFPVITINAEADIVGFGRGDNNIGGIDCGHLSTDMNLGTGYFVNGSMVHTPQPGKQLFVVYDRNDQSVPLRVVYVDFGFYEFFYTTGTTNARVDYVYIGTEATGVKQVIRKTKGTGNYSDDIAAVYAVIRPLEYNDNGHRWQNYWVPLPVEHGNGGSFVFHHGISEYHVDTNGKLIPGVVPNPRKKFIPAGQDYEGSPLTNISGYNYKGYKWTNEPDGSGLDILSGNPDKNNITAPAKVYFVYKVDPGKSNVTVSKIVTGINGNKTKDFTFTIFFLDDDGNPVKAGKAYACEGDVLPGTGASVPETDELTTISGGKAEFTLKHGQTLTIKGVQVDYQIKIIETTDSSYQVSYKDDGDSSDPGDEDMEFKPVGVGARRFDFENRKLTVPPTGIDEGNPDVETILLVLMLLTLSGIGIFTIARKRI